MADRETIDDITDEVADDMGERVSALQAEIRRIADVLTEQGFDLADRAEEAGDAIRGRAVQLADEARSEVQAVAHTARENPTAFGSVLTLVALAGFAAGFLAGTAAESSHRHSRLRW